MKYYYSTENRRSDEFNDRDYCIEQAAAVEESGNVFVYEKTSDGKIKQIELLID